MRGWASSSFFRPLDFFTEALNRGILLLQVLDALIQSAVLLKQGFRVSFLLRIPLLSVRGDVVGGRRVGFGDDGTERQRIGVRWPVIPFRGLFATVERMALVHRVREMRIGVSAHRIRLHDFRRAHFGRFRRGKRRVFSGLLRSAALRMAHPEQSASMRIEAKRLHFAGSVEAVTETFPKSTVCVT